MNNNKDDLEENLVNKKKKKEKQNSNKPEFLNLKQDDYDLDNSAHPTVAILTFLFKGLSIANYLFFSLFLSSIITFISTTLLSVIDFWITKNISGRILVGLRWWREMNIYGKEEYRFESYNKEFQFNKVDTSIFWTSQIAATLFWLALLILNILGVNLYWSILTGLQFLLCYINLYGYYQCRSEYQKKVADLKSYFTSIGLQKTQQAQGYILNKAVENYQNQIFQENGKK